MQQLKATEVANVDAQSSPQDGAEDVHTQLHGRCMRHTSLSSLEPVADGAWDR